MTKFMFLTDGGTVKLFNVFFGFAIVYDVYTLYVHLSYGNPYLMILDVPPSVQGRGTASTIFHGLYKPLNVQQFASESSSI